MKSLGEHEPLDVGGEVGQTNMAVFKPENVEDFYEIDEVLGRYGALLTEMMMMMMLCFVSSTLDLKLNSDGGEAVVGLM